MALAEGRTRWENEFRLRRADGLHAHVHEQGFIVRDSRGDARKMIAAIADVTERRDTEDLAHRLAQASRLTAMGEMAASIAHEINQPMSAILSNVDAAEMLLDAGVIEQDELRAILADIRSDDLRASEIVRHIRSLAKKQELESTTFDPNELVRSALRLAQASARGRHVAMHGIYGVVPPVHGDKIHVQQVVLNLIFNAMDAMREAAADDRVLVVQTTTAGSGIVKISVRDRGHGIRPEEFDRIFDSFYTTKADGLGLGLSIARSLIFAHGGRIWAENNSDRGAIFTFTLPVDRREPGHSG
jgi:two-component system, LuxR family, sensor kinase FixL